MVILKVLIGLSVMALIHGYVWFRVVRAARLPRRWHVAATAAIILLALSIQASIWTRNAAPGFASTLGWIAFPWMALAGLTFVAMVALDLARLVVRLGRKVVTPSAEVPSPSRRLFLARLTGGAAMAVGTTSVARGMVSARGTHEVVDVEVKIARLPKALDGFSIVQLSDLHVGLTIDRDFVQQVVDHTNRLAPDLVVLTGDLVDGKVSDLRDDAAPLAQLRARHGTYAVTGNHEYYSGADAWIAEFTRHGIRYLRNERVTIGDGAASFDLAGVDDQSASGYPGHGEDLDKALAGRDRTRALVLLAHQPRQVRRAATYGVDLQLSGHTHGGQIWPWHYIVRLQQGGLLGGRYQIDSTQLYVTRGCGYWGPPVRLLAPLEITRVVLRAV